MTERIRFHLDEHVDPDIALALRRHGIDVTTTVEVGLRTASDPEHIRFIRDEGRVVVTNDADFLRFASEETNHPGVVYWQMGTRSLGEVIRGLLLVYEVLRPNEMAGRVEFL